MCRSVNFGGRVLLCRPVCVVHAVQPERAGIDGDLEQLPVSLWRTVSIRTLVVGQLALAIIKDRGLNF